MVSERRALGERLRRQRERQGITLEAIARDTKVPASLFGGLERGDCSRWPAGIYARAYVKSYAECIGLNGAEIVEEFISAFGTTEDAAEGPAAAPRKARGAHLRLAMAEESGFEPARALKRVGLAVTDMLVALLIASVAFVGLGASPWVTVGCVIAYHTIGRLVSDQPLLYWAFGRIRTAQPADADLATEKVPVADAARTAA
jgi:transcriptional regulator with XRE-family HTH domain